MQVTSLPILPPDVHTLPLLDLEGHRDALLAALARRQARIALVRALARPGAALTAEQFDQLSQARSDRKCLQRQLRHLHELIEAVSCEEPFTPCSTPSST